MFSNNSSVWLFREIPDGRRVPMIAARHSACLVHSLLHDSPLAVGREDKRMQINLKSIGDRVVVDSCRETAGSNQRFTIKAAPIGDGAEFIRRVSRMLATPAAEVNAK